MPHPRNGFIEGDRGAVSYQEAWRVGGGQGVAPPFGFSVHRADGTVEHITGYVNFVGRRN